VVAVLVARDVRGQGDDVAVVDRLGLDQADPTGVVGDVQAARGMKSSAIG
jgi:hypothetical protein